MHTRVRQDAWGSGYLRLRTVQFLIMVVSIFTAFHWLLTNRERSYNITFARFSVLNLEIGGTKVIFAVHARHQLFLKPFRVLTQNQDKKNNFIKISGDAGHFSPQTLKMGIFTSKIQVNHRNRL